MIKEKKLISISIPCRNEEKNIYNIVQAIKIQFADFLNEYNYIIQFIDNCSTDNTRQVLREICESDSNVRAIFNTSNVPGSAIHGILQTDGECCIHMACDFQDPPELIPQMVKMWEKGAKIVCAIKTSSEEKKVMWRIRTLYYKIMSKFSSINQIDQFTGFGLYDKSFVNIIRRIEDPLITLRGLVAEYGDKVETINYRQNKRKHGKSGKSFMNNFDYAVRNFTTYSKLPIHLLTIGGTITTAVLFIVLISLMIIKILNPQLNLAVIFLSIIILLTGAIQSVFIGLIGSYIININIRTLRRPLAIEAERVGFPDSFVAKPDNSSPYMVYEPSVHSLVQENTINCNSGNPNENT